MVFLINASNLKQGGGLQVADSICCSLNNYPQHQFVVILSSSLDETARRICDYVNVEIIRYDITNSIETLFFGRDALLDKIVDEKRVECVLTIFGPSRWTPRCQHLCGFARLQLICPESPFYTRMSRTDKFKNRLSNSVIKYLFSRCSNHFYAENEWVSSRVRNVFRNSKCTTVTNYYNQVFDTPDKWVPFELPIFRGITLLTVGSNYPHKNMSILIDIARTLIQRRPDFLFRVVLTLTPQDFFVPDDVKECFNLIGPVDIAQCPSLYLQADIMIQPSLLECFSATYPEAMRMGVPILTTDLEFAHSLCKSAALYYSPLDPVDAAEKILLISEHVDVKRALISLGKQRLAAFDNYTERANKLVSLCESLSEEYQMKT